MCARWVGPKGLSPLSVLFCSRKAHSYARAPLAVLRPALEKYIGKLETSIGDKNINLSVSFMQEIPSVIEAGTSAGSAHGSKVFPQAPIIDTETG